ncbi:uncharacterized protein LOC127948437 [Carassius gibelio]|uniref:uncharacterized protein LOC127948437 n=1 Tax=Carassius gibelio TaxID=101364 RepID=UPI0022795910|nr:uncharacterized protein LOC127948437 [Carassius gibelio]
MALQRTLSRTEDLSLSPGSGERSSNSSEHPSVYLLDIILRPTARPSGRFKRSHGYQPPLFPWSGEVSEVPAVDHWFQESERVWDSAHVHLQRAVRRHTETANRRRSPNPVYLPGDKVWLSTRDIRLRLPCKKLSPRYIGPFTIHSQINPVTYRLDLPPRYRISPTFHVSLLKRHTDPVSPSSTEPEPPPPPDQPEILGDNIYQVQEILDSRRRDGHLEYLIDWEGFGPEERSWVPRNDILDPALLEDFHRQHPDRPAPRGRGRPRRRSRMPGVTRGGGGVVSHPQLVPSAPVTIASHHPLNLPCTAHVNRHLNTDYLHLHQQLPHP